MAWHPYIWSALFLKTDPLMPNLSASKKSMRQSLKAKERNYATRAELKKAMKDLLKAAKAGEKATAIQMLPGAFSIIDKSLKKNIIHRNNAARKKSLLARATA